MAVEQVAVNKKALHDYEVLKRTEAGLALLGSEIKSIRQGRVQLREAYARPEHGEIWLARNRPGGRLDSRRRLELPLARLRNG